MTKIDNLINTNIGKIEAHLQYLHAYIGKESDDAQTIAFMHRKMAKQNDTIRQLEYELFLERKFRQKQMI